MMTGFFLNQGLLEALGLLEQHGLVVEMRINGSPVEHINSNLCSADVLLYQPWAVVACPDPSADSKSRSTLLLYLLHHRSKRIQNWGFYFWDPPWALGMPHDTIERPAPTGQEHGHHCLHKAWRRFLCAVSTLHRRCWSISF